MTTIIYYLHRGDNVPFYIGKSIRPKFREYEHKTSRGNIFMEDIDEIPSKEWKFWEKHYISLFRSWGFDLENKNNGGGGPLNQNFESKNKISFSMKGKNTWSTGGYHKKSVLQYDLEGNFIKKYPSVEEARKIYKVDLASCCRGKSKTAAGFIWIYEEKFSDELFLEKIKKAVIHGNKNKKKSEQHSLNIKKAVTETNKNKRKPILQYDLEGNFIKEWDYIRQASTYLNINPSGISNNLSGKQKFAFGYIWKYKNN
jgi:hypothetical protein